MNFQDVQGLVLIYKDIPGIDLNSRTFKACRNPV